MEPENGLLRRSEPGSLHHRARPAEEEGGRRPGRAPFGQEGAGIPVLSHEELASLCLGYDPWDIGLQMHQVSVEPLLDKMGVRWDKKSKYHFESHYTFLATFLPYGIVL